MTRLRKFKNPRNKLILAEAEDLELIEANKGFDSVNEIIAELIHQKAEAIRFEKNLNAPNYGAVRLVRPDNNNTESDISTLGKQTTLDLCDMHYNEIEQIVYSIDDWGDLGRATNNAGKFYRTAKTRIYVNKEHIKKVKRTETVAAIPNSRYQSEKIQRK